MLKSDISNVLCGPYLCPNYSIPTLICGEYATYIIDNERNVYSFGFNEYYKLGQKNKGDNVTIPCSKIKSLHNIKILCCGESHTICLSFDGEVYTFGDNTYGQLGIDNSKLIETYKPQKINLSNIKQISCGTFFSLCLTDNGDMFTFGKNIYDNLYQCTPKQIEEVKDVEFILCGAYHSVCFSNGNYYSWGFSHGGRLGNGSCDKCDIPKICSKDWILDIKDIQIGDGHILLLTFSGKVYCFGENNYGQLGLGNDIEYKCNPVLIKDLPEIQSISCGFTSSFCIDLDYNLWVFGCNIFGQLGLGHLDNIYSPLKHPILSNIINISNSGSNLFVKNNNLEIYGCGLNKYSELGITTSDENQTNPIRLFENKEEIWSSTHGKSKQKSARK